MKNILIIFLFIAFQFTNLFPQQFALNSTNKFLDIYITNEADSTNLKQHHKPEGPPFLFAQEFGIKAGIGFSYTYQSDEVNYYRNKLKHESYPSFMLTFRANWHLFGNLYLAWEPGIIEKSGKISGIAYGYDAQYHDLYGYEKYTILNIENGLLLNYYFYKIKNIKLNIYFGPGLSWNVYDKEESPITQYPSFPYQDYPKVDYENPYFNNAGPYIATGINVGYNKFQFDLRFIKEYSDLGVTGIGTHKSYLFCFFNRYLF